MVGLEQQQQWQRTGGRPRILDGVVVLKSYVPICWTSLEHCTLRHR